MRQTISRARRRLSLAAQLPPAGFQQDFPGMDGVRPLGVLTHGDLLRRLAKRGANLSVRQAMRRELETASPSEAGGGTGR